MAINSSKSGLESTAAAAAVAAADTVQAAAG
jgi:hypothetical protein